MKQLYLDEIENCKKQFLNIYISILVFVLLLYIVIFNYFISNPPIVIYLTFGLFFLIYTFFLVRKKYTPDHFIIMYMIFSPLFNFYIMLTFWENSISTFVILFPLPLAAYVFFSKKEVLYFSVYLFAIVFICFLVKIYFNLHFIKYTHSQVIFSDAILFTYTFLVIFLLLIYNNKLGKLKILSDLHTREVINSTDKQEMSPIIIIDEENPTDTTLFNEVYENLFLEIEDVMMHQQPFKNANLNIAALSSSMNVNYTFISKAIRYKGFQNFNTYLNFHRINYVKKLILESDIRKMTLMYIYTEAGFSSQATFNRVFKQIVGITPSEYIQQNQEGISNDTSINL